MSKEKIFSKIVFFRVLGVSFFWPIQLMPVCNTASSHMDHPEVARLAFLLDSNFVVYFKF